MIAIVGKVRFFIGIIGIIAILVLIWMTYKILFFPKIK